MNVKFVLVVFLLAFAPAVLFSDMVVLPSGATFDAMGQQTQFLKDVFDCTLCEDLSQYNESDIFVALDDPAQVMEATLISKKIIGNTEERTPVKNAPVIVFISEDKQPFAWHLLYTDDDGLAKFHFSSYNDTCKEYTFMYCHADFGCGFDKCFQAIGVNNTKLGIFGTTDIPIAAYNLMPTGVQDPALLFPAAAQVTYCPPPKGPTPNLPAFCLPLAIIFALLGGAMYVSGRNPFSLFDLSTPRMSKVIKYTAHGRAMSADVMGPVAAYAKSKDEKKQEALDKRAQSSDKVDAAKAIKEGGRATKGEIFGLKAGYQAAGGQGVKMVTGLMGIGSALGRLGKKEEPREPKQAPKKEPPIVQPARPGQPQQAPTSISREQASSARERTSSSSTPQAPPIVGIIKSAFGQATVGEGLKFFAMGLLANSALRPFFEAVGNRSLEKMFGYVHSDVAEATNAARQGTTTSTKNGDVRVGFDLTNEAAVADKLKKGEAVSATDATGNKYVASLKDGKVVWAMTTPLGKTQEMSMADVVQRTGFSMPSSLRCDLTVNAVGIDSALKDQLKKGEAVFTDAQGNSYKGAMDKDGNAFWVKTTPAGEVIKMSTQEVLAKGSDDLRLNISAAAFASIAGISVDQAKERAATKDGKIAVGEGGRLTFSMTQDEFIKTTPKQTREEMGNELALIQMKAYRTIAALAPEELDERKGFIHKDIAGNADALAAAGAKMEKNAAGLAIMAQAAQAAGKTEEAKTMHDQALVLSENAATARELAVALHSGNEFSTFGVLSNSARMSALCEALNEQPATKDLSAQLTLANIGAVGIKMEGAVTANAQILSQRMADITEAKRATLDTNTFALYGDSAKNLENLNGLRAVSGLVSSSAGAGSVQENLTILGDNMIRAETAAMKTIAESGLVLAAGAGRDAGPARGAPGQDVSFLVQLPPPKSTEEAKQQFAYYYALDNTMAVPAYGQRVEKGEEGYAAQQQRVEQSQKMLAALTGSPDAKAGLQDTTQLRDVTALLNYAAENSVYKEAKWENAAHAERFDSATTALSGYLKAPTDDKREAVMADMASSVGRDEEGAKRAAAHLPQLSALELNALAKACNINTSDMPTQAEYISGIQETEKIDGFMAAYRVQPTARYQEAETELQKLSRIDSPTPTELARMGELSQTIREENTAAITAELSKNTFANKDEKKRHDALVDGVTRQQLSDAIVNPPIPSEYRKESPVYLEYRENIERAVGNSLSGQQAQSYRREKAAMEKDTEALMLTGFQSLYKPPSEREISDKYHMSYLGVDGMAMQGWVYDPITKTMRPR